MRIRSTKPEFWQSERIASIPWEITYDGPRPKRVNLVAPMQSGIEYVYLLFDATDRLLYVGRSFRPADRFSKHCRRDWWPEVAAVVLVAVRDDPRVGVRRAYYNPPNVAAFEHAAITELRPLHNIAGRKAVA